MIVTYEVNVISLRSIEYGGFHILPRRENASDDNGITESGDTSDYGLNRAIVGLIKLSRARIGINVADR